jgi:mono/diheme cytochrome c family protein
LTRLERGQRRRGMRSVIAAIGVAAIGVGGCTDAAGYDLDYILGAVPFLSTMRTTVSYESQTLPRLPAAGTVPVFSPSGEVVPPFTQAQLDSAAATLVNPLPSTPDVRARGAVVYQNQCFACHGAQGEGNGPIVGGGRFPLGPPVNGPTVAAQSDGYIYAIIRVGRGLMPAYGERIGHNDRWALVQFVRELQERAGTAPAPVATPPAVPDVTPATPDAGAPDPAAPAAATDPQPPVR